MTEILVVYLVNELRRNLFMPVEFFDLTHMLESGNGNGCKIVK